MFLPTAQLPQPTKGRIMYHRNNHDIGFIALAFVALAAIVLIINTIFGLINTALVGPEDSIKLVEKLGFTNVEVVAEDWFMVNFFGGCNRDDSVRFTLEATNPAGQRVELVTCDSFIGGATLRS